MAEFDSHSGGIPPSPFDQTRYHLRHHGMMRPVLFGAAWNTGEATIFAGKRRQTGRRIARHSGDALKGSTILFPGSLSAPECLRNKAGIGTS